MDNAKEASLKNPLSAASYRGIVAVTDSDRGAIKFYRKDGSYLTTINVGQNSYLVALAFNREGTLFASDKATGNVYVYPTLKSAEGSFKLKLKKVRPLSLATDETSLYIIDSLTRQLLVVPFDKIRSSLEPAGFGSFNYANGLAVNDKKIFVADSNNGRVKVLTVKGKALKQWKQKFSLPRGLAVDSLNRVHVVDTFANQVSVFDTEGNYMFSYGQAGSEDSQFYFPNGIAIDSQSGHIYITDKTNNRVVVFGW